MTASTLPPHLGTDFSATVCCYIIGSSLCTATAISVSLSAALSLV
jgi:hypothetical protein